MKIIGGMRPKHGNPVERRLDFRASWIIMESGRVVWMKEGWRFMEGPFPGMDPYIERPAIWADFHNSLITEIRCELQPRLWPKYVALAHDRLYVVASKRSVWPDVAVVEPRSSHPNGAASGRR